MLLAKSDLKQTEEVSAEKVTHDSALTETNRHFVLAELFIPQANPMKPCSQLSPVLEL